MNWRAVGPGSSHLCCCVTWPYTTTSRAIVQRVWPHMKHYFAPKAPRRLKKIKRGWRRWHTVRRSQKFTPLRFKGGVSTSHLHTLFAIFSLKGTWSAFSSVTVVMGLNLFTDSQRDAFRRPQVLSLLWQLLQRRQGYAEKKGKRAQTTAFQIPSLFFWYTWNAPSHHWRRSTTKNNKTCECKCNSRTHVYYAVL